MNDATENGGSENKIEKNNENTSTSTSESQTQVQNQSQTKPKKFVFNCTKCGKCCEKWDEIPIYMEDLIRWHKDGSLPYVMPFLQIKEADPYNINIVLKKHPSTEQNDPNPSGCPLYDYNNKICNLYYSMPIFCASYPLAYNGSKYYLRDTDCPGLGNGKMTKESLALARTRAQDHYNAKTINQVILPLIYSLILAEIMKKSQEAMSSLSEEDRKKLEELLEKSKDREKKEEKKGKTEDQGTQGEPKPN